MLMLLRAYVRHTVSTFVFAEQVAEGSDVAAYKLAVVIENY